MIETLDERRDRLGDYVLYRRDGIEARLRIAEDGLTAEVRAHGITVQSVEILAEEVNGLWAWLGDVLGVTSPNE